MLSPLINKIHKKAIPKMTLMNIMVMAMMRVTMMMMMMLIIAVVVVVICIRTVPLIMADYSRFEYMNANPVSPCKNLLLQSQEPH